MKMRTLRAMLKIYSLKVEIMIAGKKFRETINRSQFIKDTVAVDADTDLNVDIRTDGLVIHSNYSLLREVTS